MVPIRSFQVCSSKYKFGDVCVAVFIEPFCDKMSVAKVAGLFIAKKSSILSARCSLNLSQNLLRIKLLQLLNTVFLLKKEWLPQA